MSYTPGLYELRRGRDERVTPPGEPLDETGARSPEPETGVIDYVAEMAINADAPPVAGYQLPEPGVVSPDDPLERLH